MSLVIYKTPSCAYCAQTKRYLDNKGIKYAVKDVFEAAHPEYRELVKRFGYNVPLVYDPETDEGYIGWNLSKLNKMIGEQK